MKNDYCSLNSTNLQEDIFATASYFTKLLLVEYNFPWPENPLTNNHLPQEINDYLLHFKKAAKSNRVLFVKNKQKANLQINIFAINNLWEQPYTNHFIFTDHKELLNFSEVELFSKTHEINSRNSYTWCVQTGKETNAAQSLAFRFLNNYHNWPPMCGNARIWVETGLLPMYWHYLTAFFMAP